MQRDNAPRSPDPEEALGEQPLPRVIPKRPTVSTVHSPIVAVALLLRLLMSWIFFWAGFDKAINGFTAASTRKVLE